MRRFVLERIEDVTGVSGVGIVAEGVQFSDGRVAIRWKVSNQPSSMVFWDDIDQAKAIHGHDGKTKFTWLDTQPERIWAITEMLGSDIKQWTGYTLQEALEAIGLLLEENPNRVLSIVRKS